MKLKHDVGDILNGFDGVTKEPEAFVSNAEGLAEGIRALLKSCYDFVKVEEGRTTRALPELITEDFDVEQIWQQLELQNEEVLIRSLTGVSKHVTAKDRLLFSEVEETNDELNVASGEAETSDDSSGEANEEVDEVEEDEEEEEEEAGGFREKTKSSVVDDDFFKLNEMESFLNAEEKKMDGASKRRESTDGSDVDDNVEEDIDLFDAESDGERSGEEETRLHNPRYDDFFGDAKNNQKPVESEQDEEEEEEEEEGNGNDREEERSKTQKQKSTLELREERLKARIESIEQMALSEKPWQLKGEITAESRPQNSLLEEIVEFDLTSRPAPVITEQTTFQLEDIIRQRIKDRAFDSVERKRKPVETPLEYRKKLVLNQEKSKESLAQIYEREYLQQREALDPDTADKEEEEPEAHKEIEKALYGLFVKLDALSNFHFTPKMAAPELKIVSNLPAINMEEVAPVATSDATLLAPEEVKRKTKGDELGKSERTATDKKRERRKKKLKQKQHVNEKKKTEKLVNKLKPGLGNKYSKEKAKKMLEKAMKSGGNVDKMNEEFGDRGKVVKSSTAFFKQLEEDVKSQIRGKSEQKRNENKHALSAKKIKL